MSSDEFGKFQGPCETFDPKGIRRLFGIERFSTPVASTVVDWA